METIYQIYIEKFFLQNAVWLFGTLEILSVWIRCSATHRRMATGACLGSLCLCIILFIPFPAVLKIIIGYAGITALVLQYTFRIKKSRRTFARVYILSMILAMLYSGSVTLFHRMMGVKSLPFLWMMGIAFATTFFLKKILRYCFVKKRISICRASLCCQGIQKDFLAIVDTGNGLIDPISQKPVSIIEKSALLPEMQLKDESYRAIPYHCVGQKHGIMDAYMMESLRILDDEGDILIKNPIVALSNLPVSGNGHYQMILHPKLLMEREEKI